jgi:hypothetical protein
MFNNESKGGFFVDIIALGITSFVAYNAGKKDTLKRIQEQQRQDEVLELKRQLALLTGKQPS